MVLTPKQGGVGDGEGTSTNHTLSEPQEGEPSSTQVNDLVGSPITTRHIEGVPTLLDYAGSGEDSMEAAITSSQYKGLEYGTASSDSNQDASPSVGAGHSIGHDIPVSSSSPLPNLDPNFLVDQLICSQLVTDSRDVRPGQAQGSSAPVSSLSNPAGRTDDLSRVAGQRDMMTKSLGVKKTVGPVVQSTGETFPKQMGSSDFIHTQQSYAGKLAAISNIHTMRTLQNQEPGVQAKDVTSSSGGMMGAGVRPVGASAPQRPVPTSQPLIRVKKDSKIEKMTAQSSSRAKGHAAQQKGITSSKPVGMAGGVHTMPYSQSASNTSIQGRPNVTSQRMGGAMDTLPQMSTQAAPGNGNVRVSPSSQSTSHPMTYVSPTANQQRASSMHSAGSAFSTPPQQAQHSHQLKGQTPSPHPQQTSPSAGGSHNYSPNSKQYPSHQQYSPGHTSPIAAAYSTSPSYQSMGGSGYQQMPLGDLTARQGGGTGSYPNSFPMGATQTSSQTGMAQSPVDAVITGPAPGTFYSSSTGEYRSESYYLKK